MHHISVWRQSITQSPSELSFIIWIEEKDREDQEKIESDLICPFPYQLELQDSDFQALSVYFITF